MGGIPPPGADWSLGVPVPHASLLLPTVQTGIWEAVSDSLFQFPSFARI